MERLTFTFESIDRATPAAAPVVVGVVASGNLEVLVEPSTDATTCRVEVATSARGFGAVWEAVLRDFVARHAAGGLRLSLNDAGATPAVVSLRLDQAVEEYAGGRP